MALSIDRLFAYISTDEEGEGVAAHYTPSGWMPLIGADEERMKSLKPIAQQVADASGRRIVLAQFEGRIDLEVLEPDPNNSSDSRVMIVNPPTPKEDK